jgi:hypothetical protein
MTRHWRDEQDCRSIGPADKVEAEQAAEWAFFDDLLAHGVGSAINIDLNNSERRLFSCLRQPT